MKKYMITFICLLSLTLFACQKIKIFQPNIQQGNLITQEQVDQLRSGMTKNEVADIIGEPVLADSFDDNAWHYVNTFQVNGGKVVTQRLNVFFLDHRLTSVSGDFVSPLSKQHLRSHGKSSR